MGERRKAKLTFESLEAVVEAVVVRESIFSERLLGG
jgi:hypothetical protein